MNSKDNADQHTPDIWVSIDYEIEMLRSIKNTRIIYEKKNVRTIVDNALLESSLLHRRNLVEFFLDERKNVQETNLKFKEMIKDFEEENKNLLLEKSCNLGKIYGQGGGGSIRKIINKKLFHPDSSRDDSYDYQKIIDTLDKPLDEIINALTKIRGLNRPVFFDKVSCELQTVQVESMGSTSTSPTKFFSAKLDGEDN